ncbi:MAG TPA: hypothetical protein PJ984_00045 [Candidatus Saccharibacteria bacterium]|jgi:ADP-ribose pyrophosphatase|nr:ADP-ribose pyrophosphatase [Patescibacteria group bacterium]HMS30771.1 hypothetical protein [Candidatus Saccharibacteria bacterium]
MIEKISYQGRIVEVVEFPSHDGEKTFEKARRAPGTRLIIPVGEDSILLTKEYRQEVDGYDFRLPGGKVFDSLEEYNSFLQSDEDIIVPATKKAKEEAKQEVGLEVKDLEHIYTSVLGATMQWDLLYFVIKESKRGEQELEQGEDIEVVEVLRDDALKMCLDGRISEERSALVLMRYLTGNI